MANSDWDDEYDADWWECPLSHFDPAADVIRAGLMSYVDQYFSIRNNGYGAYELAAAIRTIWSEFDAPLGETSYEEIVEELDGMKHGSDLLSLALDVGKEVKRELRSPEGP